MKLPADFRLLRLLQMASPALPVGAYSYSQGLEAAIAAGVVSDGALAAQWISDVLEYSTGRWEAPLLLRLIESWRAGDCLAVRRWNEIFLAGRETAELRAETVQMGFSLARLLREIATLEQALLGQLGQLEECAFPTAFALAVAHWQIDASSALSAYLWAWLENQVMAAVKAVPLGQTDSQRILAALEPVVVATARRALEASLDDLGSATFRADLASLRHETQYTRLFRS
jgi:urease accessory protein